MQNPDEGPGFGSRVVKLESMEDIFDLISELGGGSRGGLMAALLGSGLGKMLGNPASILSGSRPKRTLDTGTRITEDQDGNMRMVTKGSRLRLVPPEEMDEELAELFAEFVCFWS